MKSPRVRLAIGFGISAVLLFVLSRLIEPEAFFEALRGANLALILPATLLYFVGLWLRSVRWGLLLPAEARKTGMLFRALAIGFTVNNLLPVRVGELARAFLLARWAGVRYGVTIASVVVERILDGLSLAGLLLVSLLFVQAPTYLLTVGLLVGAIFLVGVGVLVLATVQQQFLLSLTRAITARMPRGGGVAQRLVEGFVQGLGLIRGAGLLAQLALLSLLAWASELALFYVLMLAFNLPDSPALAVLTGTVANFATLVPSSPGYVGTFDGALIKVLSDTASVSQSMAAAYALVVHATLLVPVTLLGGVLLWRDHLSLGAVQQQAEVVQPANS